MPIFRKRRPSRTPFDPSDSLDADGTVHRFWTWCDEGCPHDSEDLLAAAIARAVMTVDTFILSTLAGHSNGWVRLGVAMNPQTPPHVQWGNGTSEHFGLASDEERWVRAVSLMRMPRPPAELIEALRD